MAITTSVTVSVSFRAEFDGVCTSLTEIKQVLNGTVANKADLAVYVFVYFGPHC